MSKFIRVSLLSALMAGSLYWLPAAAQSEEDVQVRLGQIEDQMRQLVGQMEELQFQLRQTQEQLAAMHSAAPAKKVTSLETEAAPAPAAPSQKPLKKKLAAADAAAEEGVERITDSAAMAPAEEEAITITNEDGTQVQVKKAPAPKMLGTLPGSSEEFTGQVLVAPGSEEMQATGGEQVETVALGASATETPEAVYERSYESMLRRKFGDAEAGFRQFLDQYGDHSLAGNAQYWLGETYYVQGEYKTAAQNFLSGYKSYPKSRKAPDSLLKLGMSLNRLGQNDQACAAFAAIPEKFPKAADAKKRAAMEQKRAGC